MTAMQLGVESKIAAKKLPKKVETKDSDRDILVEQYLPFATSIANKIARSISSDLDYEDILCSARLGLLEAARRFDGRFHVDFKTFSYYRIKGAIYDGLRKTGWVPRSVYSKIKFEQAANDYMQSKSGPVLEGVEKVQGEVDQVFETVNSLASIYVMSIDNMEDFEVEDPQAKKDMEHKVEFQKIKEKMRDAIEALPDKERKLVKMYYFQNKTLQEIGNKLNLSKSWVSRLHAKALEILLKRLNQIGGQVDPKVLSTLNPTQLLDDALSPSDLEGDEEDGEFFSGTENIS